MRHDLDSIRVLNSIDSTFTPNDVRPYVEYFDQYGTANDQMLAYYLLGRAHHEKGELPMALECYLNAISHADTISPTCNYAQLCRVYSQMAEVLHTEGLYREQQKMIEPSVRYAWKGKDTLAAIINYEQLSDVYISLGIKDSAIAVVEDVISLFYKYNYPKDAAIAKGNIIRTLIEEDYLAKAKEYIDCYEKESYLFDLNGNIEKGREYYYRVKGMYYLKTNNLDSAEYFFRKELREGLDFNNQNAASKGLADIYRLLGKPDSTAKYAYLSYDMNDSMYSQRTTRTTARMMAIYNYSRFNNIAIIEKQRAASEREKLYISIITLIFVISASLFILYKQNSERRNRQRQYEDTVRQLSESQIELMRLRELNGENRYEDIIEEKETKISNLQSQLEKYIKKEVHNNSDINQRIRETDIYSILHSKKYKEKLSLSELNECNKLVVRFLPNLNRMLLDKQYMINQTDFYVCVMFRLNLKSKEISNLLGISQARVSQICTKILSSVFNKKEGGAQELIETLHNIY